ncbi:MAG: TIGR03842 family LLM class F420-dependent oxidoreductase [Pseudomonadales bacterium]|nr:TIGR03842 family LLM class F420-dependent oxidoreductase [Pseudomonadales bacterium]
MDFGICFKGIVSPDRARALVKKAEAGGFTHCWFYDSHILWRDCYAAIAMCMEHTTKMRFGPCVTNPGVRDWSVAASMFASLALQSKGRFDIGLGRGDSSMRVMGKRPVTLAKLAEFAQKVKVMTRGEEAEYPDCPNPVKFSWTKNYDIPVWIAAYGPKALATAGKHGDGVILQLAEPSLIKWLADQARAATQSAGKELSNFKVMAAAPAFFGSKKVCFEATKWFPAMVGNHVADIVERYGSDSDQIPASLTAYIEGRKGYDYSKHGQSDNPYLDFITPEIVESFCILGSPADHIDKLRALEAAGVTQFNIYLDNGNEESIIDTYVNKILPKFHKE